MAIERREYVNLLMQKDGMGKLRLSQALGVVAILSC